MNSNKQTLHYDDFYYDSKQGMRRLEVHKSDLGWHLVFFCPALSPVDRPPTIPTAQFNHDCFQYTTSVGVIGLKRGRATLRSFGDTFLALVCDGTGIRFLLNHHISIISWENSLLGAAQPMAKCCNCVI
mmetsp:Transcript_29777/g.91952  ORF Transcript_29777/g.91952 Transcript_29777/m.91952 type:complete len:129 (-) Transcript_29777:3515-3901(-)